MKFLSLEFIRESILMDAFCDANPAALIHSTVNQRYSTISYWKAQSIQEVVSLLLLGITNVLDVIYTTITTKNSHDMIVKIFTLLVTQTQVNK